MAYRHSPRGHQVIKYGADHIKRYWNSPSLSFSLSLKLNPSKKEIEYIMDLYKIKIKPNIQFYASYNSFAVNIPLYLLGRYSFSSLLFMFNFIIDILNKERVKNCKSVVRALIPLDYVLLKHRKAIVKQFNCDINQFREEHKKYRDAMKVIDNISTKYITKTLSERADFEHANDIIRIYMLNNFPYFKDTILEYYTDKLKYHYEDHSIYIGSAYYEIEEAKKIIKIITKALKYVEKVKLKRDIIDYFESEILSKGIDNITLDDIYVFTPPENIKATIDFYSYILHMVLPYFNKYNFSSDDKILYHLYETYDLYKRGFISPLIFKIHLLAFVSNLKYSLERSSNKYKTDILRKALIGFKYLHRHDYQYTHPLVKTETGQKFLKLYYNFLFGNNIHKSILNPKEFIENYFIKYEIVNQLTKSQIDKMLYEDFYNDNKISTLISTLKQYLQEVNAK